MSRRKVHKGEVLCVYVMGEIFFTGGRDGDVRKWSLDTRKSQAIFPHGQTAVTCMCATGNTLYTGTDGGVAHKWLWTTGQETIRMAGHSGTITCIAASRDTVFTGSMDNQVRGWNHRRGKEATALFEVSSGDVSSKWISCMTLDGDHVLAGCDNGTVCQWNSATGDLVAIHSNMHSCAIWKIMSYRGCIITCSLDGLAHSWQLQGPHSIQTAPQQMVTYEGHRSSITALHMFGSGAQLFTASMDGMVRGYRFSDGLPQVEFRAHRSSVIHVTEHDGLLITFSDQGELCIWELAELNREGKEMAAPPRLKETVKMAKVGY